MAGIDIEEKGRNLGPVYVWDLKTGEQIHCIDAQRYAASSVAFSPDGRFALSAGGGLWRDVARLPGDDFTIRMWDLALATGKRTDDVGP